MDAQTLLNLRSRTDAKLEYARIHLDLLRERGGNCVLIAELKSPYCSWQGGHFGEIRFREA
jgi:hypothetical protein